MSDRLDRQFDEADAAVTQAVTRFASEIEFNVWEMGSRRSSVHHREHATGTVHGGVEAGP